MTHWRGRQRLGGSASPSAFGASTHAGSNLIPFPPQSVLHRENVAHSPFNVGALIFVGAVVGSAVITFIGLYYLALFIFGVH